MERVHNKSKITQKLNLEFVQCRTVYEPPFNFLKNCPFNYIRHCRKLKLSFCVLSIISAYSENMWEVFKSLRRICGKYLGILREYAERILEYMKSTTKFQASMTNSMILCSLTLIKKQQHVYTHRSTRDRSRCCWTSFKVI
jgi:hypothetical protein